MAADFQEHRDMGPCILIEWPYEMSEMTCMAKERRRTSVCMPAHKSHLLWPLNISCFSPLNHVYRIAIQQLAQDSIYISKLEFLHTYPSTWLIILTTENIQRGFQASGLVPFHLERVLSNLTVARTPSLQQRVASSNTP